MSRLKVYWALAGPHIQFRQILGEGLDKFPIFNIQSEESTRSPNVLLQLGVIRTCYLARQLSWKKKKFEFTWE